MKDLKKHCKVAIVQAAPVLFNKAACVKKAVSLIEKAGKEGADLIVFPEVWISGYPRGLSFGLTPGKRTKEGKEDWQKYYESSMLLSGPEAEEIAAAARAAKAYVGLGYCERDPINFTLYCSYAFFGPDGTLLGNHRKLKPTGSERCLWGEGSADTLKAVDTPYGPLGVLCCWENYMPLARYAMYEQGMTIHIVPFPGGNEWRHYSMRHFAAEGRCYVLVAGPYITKSMFKEMYAAAGLHYQMDEDAFPGEEVCTGGCSIVDPHGNYVVEPVLTDVDLVYGDLDMDEVIKARWDFDPTGHYDRPDAFTFSVNR